MPDITKWSSYETIAELDPLNFDEKSSEMVEANRREDTVRLIDIFNDSTVFAANLIERGIGADYAVASLRDLDFVAGSLLRMKRRDIVEDTLPTSIFKQMGHIAKTVPRGTVYTYAACNPAGERERTFTGTHEEATFIDSVRTSIFRLDDTIDHLGKVSNKKEDALTLANESLKAIVPAMITVKKAVTPEFFSTHMRPYFNELAIDSVAYAGAGGAQMQIVAIDRMLWGSDCPDEQYATYFNDNIRYLTPSQREAIFNFEQGTNGLSIVSLLERGELSSAHIDPAIDLLRTLRKFRYPHRRVAEDNFAVRPGNAVGSGQYTPTILSKLIELNEQALEKLTHNEK